jgi:hypothetical protein
VKWRVRRCRGKERKGKGREERKEDGVAEEGFPVRERRRE